jgi:hypothetical protein
MFGLYTVRKLHTAGGSIKGSGKLHTTGGANSQCPQSSPHRSGERGKKIWMRYTSQTLSHEMGSTAGYAGLLEERKFALVGAFKTVRGFQQDQMNVTSCCLRNNELKVVTTTSYLCQ